MSMTATTAVLEKRADPKSENAPEPTALEMNDRPIDTDCRFYRVIVGVHDNYGEVNYICYRKDPHHRFVLDNINFNSDDAIEDSRFIFTEDEYENLLDHLAQYNDRNLYTIAQIGRKDVDPYSLLPIK